MHNCLLIVLLCMLAPRARCSFWLFSGSLISTRGGDGREAGFCWLFARCTGGSAAHAAHSGRLACWCVCVCAYFVVCFSMEKEEEEVHRRRWVKKERFHGDRKEKRDNEKREWEGLIEWGGDNLPLNDGVQTAFTGCLAGSTLMFILPVCTLNVRPAATASSRTSYDLSASSSKMVSLVCKWAFVL